VVGHARNTLRRAHEAAIKPAPLRPNRPGALRRCGGYRWNVSQLIDRLKSGLAAVEAELKAHRSSWAYAFAMGATNQGGADHPLHARTHARTVDLVSRCRALEARIAEHEL